jgi:hypothetical protein
MQAEEATVLPDLPDIAIAAQRAARQRQKHRGSVSISRFGHVRGTHPNYLLFVRAAARLTLYT